MNILSLFILIPLLMLLGLWLSKSIYQIRGVMVAGSTILLGLAAALVFMYLDERNGGNTADAVHGQLRVVRSP